jgi:hypothetical protein
MSGEKYLMRRFIICTQCLTVLGLCRHEMCVADVSLYNCLVGKYQPHLFFQ